MTCSSPPSFRQVLIHTCTHNTVQVCGARRRKCSFSEIVGLSRPAIVSVSRGCRLPASCHVLLADISVLPSQPLCPQGRQRMSTGTETRLRASPLQQSCRIARVSFQTRSCRPFTEPMFHELHSTARSGRRQHAVESFRGPAVRFSRFYWSPCSIHLAPSSMSTMFVMPLHVLSRESSWRASEIARLDLSTSPYATPRHSATRRDGSLPIAVPSHLQRNSHQCRVQRTTSCASMEPGCSATKWKTGHHFRGFSTIQQVRIGET